MVRWRGQRGPASFPLGVGERAPQPPLPPLPRHSRPNRVVWRSFRHWRYRLFQRRRHAHPVLERVAGYPILVLPAVFNPKLLHSGEFLARWLNEHPLPSGAAILDLGTGSGIGAIAAARWARRVVAVDINPAATRCARINALLNRCADRVEVRDGDLFAPVGDERFDVVLFNPPFYRGVPRDALDLAWRSTDVVDRFAAQLAGRLTAVGSALVVLSTVGALPDFLDAFHRHGLVVTREATRDLINESLVLLRLRPVDKGSQGQGTATERSGSVAPAGGESQTEGESPR
jgi:predicted RNA methylase